MELVGPAAKWAEFIDSITNPSADYMEALALARRTSANPAPLPNEEEQRRARTTGWDALRD